MEESNKNRKDKKLGYIFNANIKIDYIIRKSMSKIKNNMDIFEIEMKLDEARYYHNILEKEEKAIKICDEILKIDNNNRDALSIKAGSLPYIGKEKEAFELTSKIIEMWPDYWEGYYLLGFLYFNVNENMAIEAFKKSIELEENFDNLIALAQLLYFLQDPGYEACLIKAKKLNPQRFKKYMKNYWEWGIC